VPLDGFGSDGWLYVNSLNGDVYKKTAGHWAWNMNIAGAQGIPGNNGAPGSRWFFGTAAPTAAMGTNLDYYLEVDSADWWQKSSGTWVIGGSLKGVPGTPGSNGAPGYSQVASGTIYGSDSVYRQWPSPSQYFYPLSHTPGENTIVGFVHNAVDNSIYLPAGSYMLNMSSVLEFITPVDFAGVSSPGMILCLDRDIGLGWEMSQTVYNTVAITIGVFAPSVVPAYLKRMRSNTSSSTVLDFPSGGAIRLAVFSDSVQGAGSDNRYMASSVVIDFTILRIQ
jgi:hypothetical protein